MSELDRFSYGPDLHFAGDTAEQPPEREHDVPGGKPVASPSESEGGAKGKPALLTARPFRESGVHIRCGKCGEEVCTCPDRKTRKKHWKLKESEPPICPERITKLTPDYD